MMQRIAALCTGPRVALLGVLAALYTVFLMQWAEQPMVSATQIAVAQQQANPGRRLPRNCKPAALNPKKQPLFAFDAALSGYGYEDAVTVLCAMEANGGEGRKLYLGRHFPADMVFPVLYGLALAGLYLFLLASLGSRSRWLPYFALVPVAAAALDLAENLVVRSLVLAGPLPRPDLVKIASALTVGKAALLVPSAVVTLGLLLWYLARQSFSRGARFP